MTRREWIWTGSAALLILVISSVPYAAGWLAQTDDWVFDGALLDRPDHLSYMARMQQGYRGEWQFRLLFTPEEHQGIYSQPLYILLGHIARICGMTMNQTFQAARLLFGALMLLVIYRFIAEFVPPVPTRRVAFLLATVSSGLGWLTEIVSPTPPGGVSPIDFWLLDAYTYLAVMNSPHFCLATALLLSILLILIEKPAGPSPAKGLLAIALSVALGLVHPYTLLLADLLPVLFWAVKWVRTRQVPWRGLAVLIGMGVAQLPLVIYDLWVFSTQPIFVGWATQNITLSPPLGSYLWGYGVLLVLGAIGAVAWARRGEGGLTFACLWIGFVAILVYLPWNLQRRFLEGVQVPLGIAAGVGLAEVLLPQRTDSWDRLRRLALVGIVALSTVSNLLLTTGSAVSAASLSTELFSPRSLVGAVEWLGDNGEWYETVLASPAIGSLIPARTGHRVVVGHRMETVEYDAKLDDVRRFFDSATPDAERMTIVIDWGVAYVFHGPTERSLGDFDPGSANWLAPVFTAGGVTIYHISAQD